MNNALDLEHLQRTYFQDEASLQEIQSNLQEVVYNPAVSTFVPDHHGRGEDYSDLWTSPRSTFLDRLLHPGFACPCNTTCVVSLLCGILFSVTAFVFCYVQNWLCFTE